MSNIIIDGKINKILLSDYFYNPIVIDDKLISTTHRSIEDCNDRIDTLCNYMNSGESILDLGCNTGYILFELKRRGLGKCIGIDNGMSLSKFPKLNLSLAKLYNLDVEFIKGEIDYMINKYKNDNLKFDNIMYLSVVNIQECISRIYNLLEIGNKIFIEPTNHESRVNNEQYCNLYDEINNLSDDICIKILSHTMYQNRFLLMVTKKG